MNYRWHEQNETVSLNVNWNSKGMTKIFTSKFWILTALIAKFVIYICFYLGDLLYRFWENNLIKSLNNHVNQKTNIIIQQTKQTVKKSCVELLRNLCIQALRTKCLIAKLYDICHRVSTWVLEYCWTLHFIHPTLISFFRHVTFLQIKLKLKHTPCLVYLELSKCFVF